MKRWISLLLTAVLGATLFVGCSSGAGAASKTPPAPATSGESKPEVTTNSDYKIAMVASGVFGDQGMNDAMLAGMKKFTDETGIEVTSVEISEFSDQAINARNFAQQGYDVVVMAGPVSEIIPEIATEYPDTHFVLNKGSIDDLPNVTSVKFDEAGAAFLGGVFAAMMSEELGAQPNVGWVGGERLPDLEKARYAFSAAVEYKGGTVDVVYVGSFTDIAKSKEITLKMFNAGTAIVQAYAGGASNGVYQAAETQGDDKYAMGCATGQFHLSPDKIISSSVVRYDNIFSKILIDFASSGKIEPGIVIADLDNSGTGLLYSPNIEGKIPEAIKSEIESVQAKIVSGEIKVPTSEEEYNAFITGLK